MTLAVIDYVADAVVAELNDGARSWAGQFQAERTNYPLFEGLDKLIDLKVSVVSKSRELNNKLSKGRRVQNHRIDIAVQQKPADVSSDSFDPLKLLTQQIESWFLDDEHNLETYTASEWARCISSVIDPFPSLDHIERFRSYTAIVQLTFEVLLP